MHSTLISRPHSVIQIIDIPDATENNPQPEIETEEDAFKELISKQKLKEVAGISNLFDLYELKIKVDTTDTSIGNIGKMAPNLKKLNLSNSYINSIRDLGTSLNNLTVLWLSRCCLNDLDGIVSIPYIKELYLPYNEVSDISPLSMMENLEVLDLEGNNVDDILQVEFLSLCVNLTALTLKGNPVEYSPSKSTEKQDLKFYIYKDAVLSRLPQLSMLDEKNFLEENAYQNVSLQVQGEKSFTEDMLILQQRLKALEDLDSTIYLNKTESCRLQIKQVCSTPLHEKVQKVKNLKTNASNNTDVSSQLTNGLHMCGNPVQALRSRLKKERSSLSVNQLSTSQTCITEGKKLSIQNGESLMNDVFEELRLWRSNNCRVLDQMDADNISLNRIKSNRPHTASDFRARQYRMVNRDCAGDPAAFSAHMSKNISSIKSRCFNRSLIVDPSSLTRPYTAFALKVPLNDA